MNRKQSLDQFREALMLRQEALLCALNGDLTMLQEMRKCGCDVVDFASDSAAEELSSQLAEVESRELVSIASALKKLKDNKYGLCEECEKYIPLTRLQALPYASLCINCQRILEEEEEMGTGSWPIVDTPGMLEIGDADPV